MHHYVDFIAEHAERDPGADALCDGERRVSWGEFADTTDRLAAGLETYGISPGDRVALLEMNTIEFAEITVACTKAGAILVPMNWRLTPHELARTMESAKPALLLIGTTVAELGERLLAEHACSALALEGPEVQIWRQSAPPAGWRPAARTDDMPVCITYTSGSTGAPKGVVMPHSAFSSTLPAVVEAEGITAESSCLQVLPLFHIGGLAWLISAFLAGATSVMLRSAVPKEILAAVDRERITHLCVVSTLLQMILDEQRRNPVDVSSVEMIQCGASPMPEAYLREAGQVFGCTIVTLYGLSEAGGLVCNQLITPDEISAGLGHRLLASGWPISGVEVQIRSAEPPFDPVPAGEVGEIVVRGPGSMSGYWQQPELTASVLSPSGWLRTGDLGFVDDDGLLFVKGRVKDLIISGGENIYPAEIENVIAEMDGVAQVAVVGAPHPRWGESPVAVITPEDGAAIDESAVESWCRDRLAGYKQPRRILVAQTLPLLGGGKVDRNTVKDQVAGSFADAESLSS